MYLKYERLKLSWEELKDFFTIDSPELNIIKNYKPAKNQLGFAVQLKSFGYLGYAVKDKKFFPKEFIEHIAEQLSIDKSLFLDYEFDGRTGKRHLSFIRENLGFRLYTKSDYLVLSQWLRSITMLDPRRDKIAELLVWKLREEKIELPSKKEFARLVSHSRKSFHESFFHSVSDSLTESAKQSMDEFLLKGKTGKSLAWLKTPAASVSIKTLQSEIEKLNTIRSFAIDPELFAPYHKRFIDTLYRRVKSKDISGIRSYKKEVRYSLLAVYLFVREMEVTDTIIKLFIELVRKVDNKTEQAIERDMSKNMVQIHNKTEILKKLTFAIIKNPFGTIEDVILSRVDLETLNRLSEEFKEEKEQSFKVFKFEILKKKYTGHYRQMLKPVLDNLDFKSNNSTLKNLLDSVKIIHRYSGTSHIYYPEEEIPLELITGSWEKVCIEENDDGLRVKKHYFELCILEKLERLLKCKEIYVDRAVKYGNPDYDLPSDWEEKRKTYYEKLKLPLNPKDYIEPIKLNLKKALEESNDYFDPEKETEVYIFSKGKNVKGNFRVPRIKKRDERPILKEIRKKVIKNWGILDLLDILLEADRQIGFTKFFYSHNQREILSANEIKERLLLCIFALGTNMGLKRAHSSAKPGCSYKDLHYFKRRYIHPDSLRETISALTNQIFELRSKEIWGFTTAIASDGKQFASWDQNLMADSNPHYRDPGIMVYWHVDTNATCIFSQIRNCNSSKVTAMIEGLVHHATQMYLESNYVDSKGQSEIAFAFCHLLGIRLMPRLKRTKYQKLHSVDKESAKDLLNLEKVLARPIRWNKIYEQYDEMIKHLTAIVENPTATESILRRFTSYNIKHPTYKAFIELGKAVKTEFLCDYLTNKELRVEIHEGLNIVENWNSVNTQICFGSKSEFQTNDPQTQEMIVLCLHLLQNAVILANTIMIDRVIESEDLLKVMTKEDKLSLNPLYTSNFNPYGGLNLDLEKPSFLEAA